MSELEERLARLERDVDRQNRDTIGIMARQDRLWSEVLVNGEHETTLRGEISRLDARVDEVEAFKKSVMNKVLSILKWVGVALLSWMAGKGWIDPSQVKDLAGP